MTCTKAEHDAAVEIRQRPYTDTGMRSARSSGEVTAEVAGLTVVDEYVNHYRKARRHA